MHCYPTLFHYLPLTLVSLKWVNRCADSVTLRRACCRSCNVMSRSSYHTPFYCPFSSFTIPTAQIRETRGEITPNCDHQGSGSEVTRTGVGCWCCCISIIGQGEGSYAPLERNKGVAAHFTRPLFILADTQTVPHIHCGSCLWWASKM